MNKVYILVYDLLREYGQALAELLQFAKNGKLVLYYMPRDYEYEHIGNFDCFVDDWIARERDKITKQYNCRQIYYPDERSELTRSLQASMGRYGGEQRNFRVKGQDAIAVDRYKRALSNLEDRDGVARYLIKRLFVKVSEYENMTNSGKLPRKNKNQDTGIRIKKTLEACRFVEMKYGPILLNKSKCEVLNLVREEMDYKEPHRETFNKWFRDCPFTRGAGNPNNRKKRA